MRRVALETWEIQVPGHVELAAEALGVVLEFVADQSPFRGDVFDAPGLNVLTEYEYLRGEGTRFFGYTVPLPAPVR